MLADDDDDDSLATRASDVTKARMSIKRHVLMIIPSLLILSIKKDISVQIYEKGPVVNRSCSPKYLFASDELPC